AVLAFAALRNEHLASWIEEYVTFPSSMVDRITPTTTAADRALVERTFGVRDRWPVITEPFSQWVVEDSFCNGRPPLDEVGVQFVEDVRPYALMKTRLLNGSHCALGHLGLLAGHDRMDEAMADPLLATYATRLVDEEVAPLLPRVAGFDLAGYRGTMLRRLANPRIGDQLARLCRGAPVKVARHVVPSIAEARARRRPHPLLTLAVAGFCAHDPSRRPTDPAVFGPLARDAAFVAEVDAALDEIARLGVRAALAGGERRAA
ncbi:MAG TPA: mannitol dehydrogenase family protein, partial [Solirubrobacteraceae bacterium]|nr:mannitol dehydrogenase family protein [Solirubrobacteraceae bacterium]